MNAEAAAPDADRSAHPSRSPTPPRRFQTGAALLVGALLVWIAYLHVWQRGFYLDDYSNRTQVVQVATGEHAPIWAPSHIPGFPVRFLAWAINRQLCLWQTDYEFPIRLGCAFFCAVNALLAGWLARRVLGSWLAGFAAGMLMIAPYFSFEALLWIGAVSYILTLTLMLAGMILLLEALLAKTRAACVGFALIGGALSLSTILFFEQPLFTLGGLPLLAGAVMLRRVGGPTRRILTRGLLIGTGLVLVAGAWGLAFYRDAQMVDSRGGLDLNPARILERVAGYVERVTWMTHGRWGAMLHDDVWNIGRHLLMGSPAGIALLAATLIGVILLALRYKPGSAPTPAIGVARTLGVFVCVFGAGAAIYALTLAFPAALVAGQILEYRMLYFPHLGACLMIAATVWLIERATGAWMPHAGAVARIASWTQRGLIAGIAALALHDAICMLGFSDALAKRHQLDRAQIVAFCESVPPETLPHDPLIVAMAPDGRLYGHDDVISQMLFGVFEAPWCAEAVLGEAYRRDDLVTRTLNRWVGVTFQEHTDPQSGARSLRINETDATLERTIPFVIRGTQALFVERVALTTEAGDDVTFDFPAVANLPASARRITLAVFNGKPSVNPKVVE